MEIAQHFLTIFLFPSNNSFNLFYLQELCFCLVLWVWFFFWKGLQFYHDCVWQNQCTRSTWCCIFFSRASYSQFHDATPELGKVSQGSCASASQFIHYLETPWPVDFQRFCKKKKKKEFLVKCFCFCNFVPTIVPTIWNPNGKLDVIHWWIAHMACRDLDLCLAGFGLDINPARILWNSEFKQLMAIDFPLFLPTFGYLPNHMALSSEPKSIKNLFIH